MPQRPKSIELTDADRGRLEDVVSRPTSTAREYVRAKILLLKGQGMTNAAVAEKLDVTAPTVSLCVRKFEEGGVEAALADAPGRGRPTEISEADAMWVVEKACVKPKDCGHAAEIWYPALLTRHVRSVAEAEGHPRMATVAETTVRRILADARVRPFTVTYYCERRDPRYDEKAHDVL
ncbi:MAG: helix-turn-helix domain-containing protein, partial [Coriobacteriales bacterium]|nr:helix-turn-helix domain-containing protein [Coriobacteriales bacterium]